MLNPVQPMAAAFMNIFDALPLPFRSLFYVSLVLAFLYALFKILSG